MTCSQAPWAGALLEALSPQRRGGGVRLLAIGAAVPRAVRGWADTLWVAAMAFTVGLPSTWPVPPKAIPPSGE